MIKVFIVGAVKRIRCWQEYRQTICHVCHCLFQHHKMLCVWCRVWSRSIKQNKRMLRLCKDSFAKRNFNLNQVRNQRFVHIVLKVIDNTKCLVYTKDDAWTVHRFKSGVQCDRQSIGSGTFELCLCVSKQQDNILILILTFHGSTVGILWTGNLIDLRRNRLNAARKDFTAN